MNWKRKGKKEQIINDVKGEVAALNEKYDKMSSILDWKEQCCRRNYFLIHDVPEDNKEDTDETAVEFFNTKMDVSIKKPRS